MYKSDVQLSWVETSWQLLAQLCSDVADGGFLVSSPRWIALAGAQMLQIMKMRNINRYSKQP